MMGTGSSPRAWGTLAAAPDVEPMQRFIPTRVGNTPGHHRSRGPGAVHPHARGEHGIVFDGTRPGTGSSPRAWGTLLWVIAARSSRRFIPTRVGNTPECRPPAPPRAVHPHARGEHRLPGPRRFDGSGSSPRAWGTLGPLPYLRWPGRFIPTRVGNTSTSRMRPDGPLVHPHARGEHEEAIDESQLRCGSSPRAWGTPARAHVDVVGNRFIPTRVGNTDADGISRARSSVHPHARGEHWRARPSVSPEWGSSPRAWGTHGLCLRLGEALRFIPTRVGNTGAPA